MFQPAIQHHTENVEGANFSSLVFLILLYDGDKPIIRFFFRIIIYFCHAYTVKHVRFILFASLRFLVTTLPSDKNFVCECILFWLRSKNSGCTSSTWKIISRLNYALNNEAKILNNNVEVERKKSSDKNDDDDDNVSYVDSHPEACKYFINKMVIYYVWILLKVKIYLYGYFIRSAHSSGFFRPQYLIAVNKQMTILCTAYTITDSQIRNRTL